MSRSLTAVRVDLTTRKPYQERLLKKYAIRGVPTILFFDRQGSERKDLRIETYLGKEEVLHRMKRVVEKGGP
jgi:thiol:disulfide interchange protein DsbD